MGQASENPVHKDTTTGAAASTRDAPHVHHGFTSGTQQVRDALDHARSEVRALGVEDAICDTSQIILGEVLNNVVEHAYQFDEGHPIELSIWLIPAGLLCAIQDQGAPMPNGVPPAGVGPTIDTTSRDALPEGGFGWAMVRELTQDLTYHRTNGHNDLSFVIPIPRP